MKIITYANIDLQLEIPDVIFFQDTLWMSQEQIGKLYATDTSGISRHIRKIYNDKELTESQTSISESKLQKMQDSFKKPKKYYNLQIIIAIGFKVNSPQAIIFRTWANNIIDEYSRIGYALDDVRLKEGENILSNKRDYEGLMERVRAIRFDERNIYEKIKDLFITAIDYNTSSQEAIDFFQTIQNKFHYAIVGMTSPEILLKRVNSEKPALGIIHHTKRNITIFRSKCR